VATPVPATTRPACPGWNQVAEIADGLDPVIGDEYEIGYCYSRYHAVLPTWPRAC